jgi:hypothetical protein
LYSRATLVSLKNSYHQQGDRAKVLDYTQQYLNIVKALITQGKIDDYTATE